MNDLSSIKSMIQEIRADNSSGAAELTRKAADVFIELSKIKTSEKKEFLSLLPDISRELIESQPSMSPILNMVNSVLIKTEEGGDAGKMRQTVGLEAQRFIREMNSGLEEIISQSLCTIKNVKSNPSVLTYSYSSTVCKMLIEAKKSGLNLSVICTESRPALEGKRLAEKLRQANIPVTYAVDMLAFSLIKEGKADLIMVGGDSVSTGGLINKIGTLGLAVFAKKFRVPFYALSGTEKFISPKLMPFLRVVPRDREEVLITGDEGINVVNRYFDITPLSLIDGVITEIGVLKGKEIKEKSENIRVSGQLLGMI